ncbi:MAG: ATP-binding protein [Rhizobiaceae bacterium]|nr:ATP-binding protein [Rhizobiaceae bacterium]
MLASTTAFTAGLNTFPAFAQQDTFSVSNLPVPLNGTSILMLAVFGGAMSFALLSAFWMIRERARVSEENRALKVGITELKAANDRNEALLTNPGQMTIVWNQDEQPVSYGTLSTSVGAPDALDVFLNFSAWADAASSETLDRMIRELCEEGRTFETTLRAKNVTILNVTGNTSGSYAYARFSNLEKEREEHVKLKTKHERLETTFSTLENLLRKLPMPFWIRSEEGKLSWVNSAYTDAVDGETPKDVVQKNLDLFDPGLRDRIHEADADGNLFHEEVPATVAGDRKRLEVFGMRSEAGTAGIAIDKSDLEQTRRMLEETNDSHARMLDQLATAVAIFDKSKKLVFFNSGFQQLWQLDSAFLDSSPSNAEVLDAMRDGKLLPDHPDWRKWRDGQLEIYQALETSEEWWHLMDGQTVRVVVSPQNTGGAAWVFENVTERLALESNYNSLIRIQGETLDHLSEAVAVFASDGKLKLFNPALEELWANAGIEVAEGIHISGIIRDWNDSISNEQDLHVILGKITGFDDQRDGISGRMHLRSDKTLEYSVVPLPEGQSMLTMVDISANVNFEKALKERAEALEASDLLKSKFIQHVSYELRAPLTSISGFGELLGTPEIGELNKKQNEYLGHIHSSVQVLRTLVDDILDLASIDAETVELNLTNVGFQSSIDSVLVSLIEPIQQKSLQINVHVAKQADYLVADSDRFCQILKNLISNAVNFSPENSTISISGALSDGYYDLRVRDEGPGVDAEKREHIFNRFESEPATGKRTGTGLGLSIVKGFVELHGGSVQLEETAESGASFLCRFPQKEIPADSADRDHPAIENAANSNPAAA